MHLTTLFYTTGAGLLSGYLFYRSYGYENESKYLPVEIYLSGDNCKLY